MAATSKPKTRPGITTLGKVTTIGNVTTISGWTLTNCAIRCNCHYGVGPERPIYLISGTTEGYLGLRSFAANGKCSCCAPWTADELASVLNDLAAITAIDTSEPSAETP